MRPPPLCPACNRPTGRVLSRIALLKRTDCIVFDKQDGIVPHTPVHEELFLSPPVLVCAECRTEYAPGPLRSAMVQALNEQLSEYLEG